MSASEASQKTTVAKESSEPVAARAVFEHLNNIGNRLATSDELAELVTLMNKAKGGPYLDPEEGERMRNKLVASGAIKISKED